MNPLRIIVSSVLIIACQLVPAQQKNQVTWEKWNFLVGEWVGEGNGQPGKGEGKFSFATDLSDNILVRKNHTVFPATEKSKEMVHDDLLVIYQPSPGGAQEAIYFDNEGNTIKYKVSYKENSVVLTSDISPGTPRFRLSYQGIDNKTVNVTFEIASPDKPEEFRMYLSGKAFKTK